MNANCNTNNWPYRALIAHPPTEAQLLVIESTEDGGTQAFHMDLAWYQYSSNSNCNTYVNKHEGENRDERQRK